MVPPRFVLEVFYLVRKGFKRPALRLFYSLVEVFLAFTVTLFCAIMEGKFLLILMKKNLPLVRFGMVGLLLFLQTALPVYAQYTVLPTTQKTKDECKGIIDKFDQTGQIPSPQEADAAQKYQDTVDNLDKATKALNDAKTLAAQADDLKAKASSANDTMTACVKANGPDYKGDNCDAWKYEYEQAQNAAQEAQQAQASLEKLQKAEDDASNKFIQAEGTSDEHLKSSDVIDAKENLLGCAIKTGRISLAIIPFFITYIINFILSLIGLVAVLFIVIGGYRYVFGGLTDDKDKGKKTIKDALVGMAVALLAWSIVNVILKAITG